MNHKTHTDLEAEFSSIMIVVGILIQQFTEEDLVESLQRLIDSGQPIDRNIFLRVQMKLADEEHYELANVVKTFIDYNCNSKIEV